MDIQIIVKVGDMDTDNEGRHHWSIDSCQQVGLITTTTQQTSTLSLEGEVRDQATKLYQQATAHRNVVSKQMHEQSDPATNV